MKAVKVNLGDSSDKRIEIFADLHLGSARCDYNLIKSRIEFVKNNENTYAIILGDLINNSTKASVGDVYEEQISPMNQIKLAVNLFEPIKDKIIGVTAGNHERRSYKSDGIDLTYFFCKELGVEDRYDYTSCVLFMTFGEVEDNHKTTYTLYMTHGDHSGGRTIGAKANAVQRRSNIVNADITVVGHTHAPLAFYDERFEIDMKHHTVVKRETLCVNAGATLDYEAYAELVGLPPSSKRNPSIVLRGGVAGGGKRAYIVM